MSYEEYIAIIIMVLIFTTLAVIFLYVLFKLCINKPQERRTLHNTEELWDDFDMDKREPIVLMKREKRVKWNLEGIEIISI